jgi:energy-coupling factor transporter ATP-binding protein EcfA2
MLASMIQNNAAPIITSISVRNLFGRRSYDLDMPTAYGQSGRMTLLHGENGSGKTTLLRLVWNALCAADNRGHRTFIAKTPFQSLTIQMTANRTIHIEKTDGLVGDFTVTLSRPGVADVVAEYETDDDLRVRSRYKRGVWELEEHTVRVALRNRESSLGQTYASVLEEQAGSRRQAQRAETEYLQFLNDEIGSPLYLADDRSLYSDDEDIERIRASVSRHAGGESGERRSRESLVFLELNVTLRRVNEYLRSLTIGGQNDGSATSNSIYADVLRELATPDISPNDAEGPSSAAFLLQEIGAIAPSYETYGLVPNFDSIKFSELLESIGLPDRRVLADRVLTPYLSSMLARYTALKEAQGLLSALIPTINGFLRDKLVTFSPKEGLNIVTADGNPLLVESLSSGERQLLMLLCTTLLSRVDTKLFIIDEPELSLGVEWQRKILSALQLLTESSDVQFLIATHSIEIISGDPDSVISLKA